MSNRWTAFEEEEEVVIPQPTSNPLRKIKKKIRKKQEKYDKSPSPELYNCLLYTSPSPRDATLSRMPSSA